MQHISAVNVPVSFTDSIGVAPAYYRLPDLTARTTFSRATIYRLIKEEGFPAPIRLTPQAVAWIIDEVETWLSKRIANAVAARNSQKSGVRHG